MLLTDLRIGGKAAYDLVYAGPARQADDLWKAAALFKGPGFPLGFRVACGEATVTGSRDD